MKKNGCYDFSCDDCNYKEYCDLELGMPNCENCKFNEKYNYQQCDGCTAISITRECKFER